MIEKLWKGFPKSVLLESIRSQRPSISQSISAVPFTGGAPIITVSVVQDPRNFLSTSWFFPGSVHFFIFAISLAMSGGSCGHRAKRAPAIARASPRTIGIFMGFLLGYQG